MLSGPDRPLRQQCWEERTLGQDAHVASAEGYDPQATTLRRKDNLPAFVARRIVEGIQSQTACKIESQIGRLRINGHVDNGSMIQQPVGFRFSVYWLRKTELLAIILISKCYPAVCDDPPWNAQRYSAAIIEIESPVSFSLLDATKPSDNCCPEFNEPILFHDDNLASVHDVRNVVYPDRRLSGRKARKLPVFQPTQVAWAPPYVADASSCSLAIRVARIRLADTGAASVGSRIGLSSMISVTAPMLR